MKRFIATIVIFIILVSLVGCAESNTDRFDNLGFTVIDHVGNTSGVDYYLVYDNETNVIYYLSYTGSMIGITLCPRYDSNGEVMIHGG